MSPIEILADDGTKVGQLPVERNYIPFEAIRETPEWASLGRATSTWPLGDKLCCSTDGGRTWKSRDLPVPSGGFGILRRRHVYRLHRFP